MTATASAPGKVMLAGEYAVLDGTPAIVAAVDRRAVATAGPAARATPTPFLDDVAAAIAARLGDDCPAVAWAARVTVDSGALASDRGVKLGLGSSAAVTVAATACALAAAGLDPARPLVHELAHAAHRAAQARRGAAGSGADVAASVWGGVVRVVPATDPDRPPAVDACPLPAGLILSFVWTGRAAHTPVLVAAVRELRATDASAYAACCRAIAAAADALVTACRAGDARAAVNAIGEGAVAVAALGAATKVDLETDAHRRLAELAASCDGACKPTGAGGGDVALAAFASTDAAMRFRGHLQSTDMRELAVAVDPRGIDA